MRKLLVNTFLALCVCFTTVKAAQFGLSRIPPFHEGACLAAPGLNANIKVLNNHILEGTSDIQISISGVIGFVTKIVTIPFENIRAESGLTEVSCE